VTDGLELAGDRSLWRQIATAECYGWRLQVINELMHVVTCAVEVTNLFSRKREVAILWVTTCINVRSFHCVECCVQQITDSSYIYKAADSQGVWICDVLFMYLLCMRECDVKTKGWVLYMLLILQWLVTVIVFAIWMCIMLTLHGQLGHVNWQIASANQFTTSIAGTKVP